MLINKTTGVESTAAIDPAKVLIIVNSSAACSVLSNAGADAYCSLRGIPLGNRLSLNLSDGSANVNEANAGAQGQTFRPIIQAAIASGGYEAVLFSMATPTRFVTNSYSAMYQLTAWNAVDNCGSSQYDSSLGTDSVRYTKHHKFTTGARPCIGRIGFPTWDGTSTALLNESISLMQDRVRKALAAEASGVWANAKMLFGIFDRNSIYLPALPFDFANALSLARAQGFTPDYWARSLAAGQTVSGTAWDSYANINAGIATPKQFLLTADCSFVNPWASTLVAGSPLPFGNSFAPQDGAIWMNWTSFGFQTGHEMAMKGASVYLSSTEEPSAAGLISATRMLDGLLKGLSVCELGGATSNCHATPIGDPLYAPFKNLRRATWAQ